MFNKIHNILKQKNILTHHNSGILIAKAADNLEGISLARGIVDEVVDKKTFVLLSGGRTPKELYKSLATEEALQPGAVGMVDERYGEKFHVDSNEKMIEASGLLRYLSLRHIPFYPILAKGETREEIADDYNSILRELQSVYQTSIGILGIGLDGHTAGIPSLSSKVKVQKSKLFSGTNLVTEYHDVGGKYGERVTMTFLGLSHLDLFLVLVFGDDKKEALDLVFSEGSEEEVPGRFYRRPEIAKKTLIITDQPL
jgi:6-phosphogluconolactonase/glucosamine-6-phosphate isomerase/deaminase